MRLLRAKGYGAIVTWQTDRRVVGRRTATCPPPRPGPATSPTNLTCVAVDQAALYGLLRKVRDLGLPLISGTPTLNTMERPLSTDTKSAIGGTRMSEAATPA